MDEDSTKEQVLQLVRTGMVKGNADIARELGVSRQWVWYILKQEGLRVTAPRVKGKVAVVCPRCGLERNKFSSVAKNYRTGLYRSCWNKSPEWTQPSDAPGA